jgi:hypothetical protein
MALSGTIKGYPDNSNYTLTCEWNAVQDIEKNISVVTANVYLKAPIGWSFESNWNCTINNVQITNNQNITITSTKTLIGTRTWTINHTTNGTASFLISYSISNNTTTSNTQTIRTGTGTEYITLDTIPRGSKFTLSNSSLTMGKTQTINISKTESTFKHTVSYTFADISTVVASYTDSATVSFVPPKTLANQIPTSLSGICTVKVETFDKYYVPIGISTQSFTLNVPTEDVPSITLKTVENNTLNGVLIASKSTITITPSATAQNGAWITSYTYSGAGLSGTGSSKTTKTLSANTYTISVTATDSRGLKNVATKTYVVDDYFEPICSLSSYRSDYNGIPDPYGTDVRLKIDWNISNPANANKNAKKYTLYYKRKVDPTWKTYKTEDFPSYSGKMENYVVDAEFISAYEYVFKLVIKDTFSEITATSTVPITTMVLNLEKDGLAIGKKYERGRLDIEGVAYISNGELRFSHSPSTNSRIGYILSDEIDDKLAGTYISNGRNTLLRLNDNGTLTYDGYDVLIDRGQGLSIVGTFYSSGGLSTGGSVSSSGGLFTTGSLSVDQGGYVAKNFTVGGTLSVGAFSTNGQVSAGAFATGGTVSCGAVSCGGTVSGGGFSTGGNIYAGSALSSNGTLNVAGSGSIGGALTAGALTSKSSLVVSGETYAYGVVRFGGHGSSRIGMTTNDTSGSCTFIAGTSGKFLRLRADNLLTWAGYTVHKGTSSDGRYKFILDDIKSEDCYNLIKDMNLYGYALLDKRIDKYKNMTEISDELEKSSYMNIHMGFIAQDIIDNDLSKYIVNKHILEKEDGGDGVEYKYGIDNYAYSTAIHGALKHEIKLREQEIKGLKEEIESLKNEIKKIK